MYSKITSYFKKVINQQAQILVLTALLLPLLIAGTGLAVDFGNLYIHKSKLQNAADAAAIRGFAAYNASLKASGNAETAKADALTAAQASVSGTNGNAIGANVTNLKVATVTTDNSPQNAQNGSGTTTTSSSQKTVLGVIVTQDVPVYFLKYFTGVPTSQTVSADAYAQQQTTTTTTRVETTADPDPFDYLFSSGSGGFSVSPSGTYETRGDWVQTGKHSWDGYFERVTKNYIDLIEIANDSSVSETISNTYPSSLSTEKDDNNNYKYIYQNSDWQSTIEGKQEPMETALEYRLTQEDSSKNVNGTYYTTTKLSPNSPGLNVYGTSQLTYGTTPLYVMSSYSGTAYSSYYDTYYPQDYFNLNIWSTYSSIERPIVFVYLSSVDLRINFNSGTGFYGIIYAPNAKVTLNLNGSPPSASTSTETVNYTGNTFTGSIVGKTIAINNTSKQSHTFSYKSILTSNDIGHKDYTETNSTNAELVYYDNIKDQFSWQESNAEDTDNKED